MSGAHVRKIPIPTAHRVTLAALCALALLLGPVGASAGPRGSAGPDVKVTASTPRGTAARVSVEAVNADVTLVLRALADVGKLSVVFADGATGRVTVSLRDVPLADAMNSVAWAAGLGIAPLGGTTRVVSP